MGLRGVLQAFTHGWAERSQFLSQSAGGFLVGGFALLARRHDVQLFSSLLFTNARALFSLFFGVDLLVGGGLYDRSMGGRVDSRRTSAFSKAGKPSLSSAFCLAFVCEEKKVDGEVLRSEKVRR